MYEILESDAQDYKQKWLEAERDLALMSIPIICEPFNHIDEDIEPAEESHPNSKGIEDYEPGVTQAQVLKALKKVAKAKPSRKPS